MVSTLLALSAWLATAGPANTSAPAWEKIFAVAGPDDWIASVWASSRDDWFVGGMWGVAWATKARTERRSTPGRAVMGLFGDSATSVFAFGAGETVLHFDGKKWVEEHMGAVPPKHRRRGTGAPDLLQFAYRLDTPESPLVAVGPSLVLVRQADGTWTRPAEDERNRLFLLGQTGPAKISKPSKCDPGPWSWLGKGLGWFACEDGRSFLYDGGKVTPQGKIPKGCVHSLTGLAMAKSEFYAACASTLWKTNAQSWRPLAVPDGEEKEFGPVSVAGDCVFVAGRHAVWRSCESTHK